MKHIFLISLICLFTQIAQASEKVITIAVLDSGFGKTFSSRQTTYLCKFGHKDFTKDQSFLYNIDGGSAIPEDRHGHGTNVAGLIIEHAKLSNKRFCLVIIKTFGIIANDNLQSEIDGINYAKNIKADLINFSGGGREESYRENKAVKEYIDEGGVFFAAAGNENENLAQSPYYPACSDNRVIVSGNLGKNLEKVPSSNYGKRVNRWEYGVNAEAFGLIFTGTSQASAIATGKYLSEKQDNMIKLRKQLQ